MLKLISRIFSLLDNKQKSVFKKLQFLIILMSIFEMLTITMLAPFLMIVGNQNYIHEKELLSYIYNFLDFKTNNEFILSYSFGVIVIIIISMFLSTYTTWKLSKFSSETGTEVSNKLFSYYLKRDYLYYLQSSSSIMTKNITNEVQRLTMSVITPFMQVNAKVILISIILIMLVCINPVIAISIAIVYCTIYYLIFKMVKVILSSNGSKMSVILENRYRFINESLGSIRDILINNKYKYFEERFYLSSNQLAKIQALNVLLFQLPRYFIEFITFISIVLVIIVFIDSKSQLETIIPMVTIYAFSAFKLLPAFQAVYGYSAEIKNNLPAFESIYNDWYLSEKMKVNLEQDVKSEIFPILFKSVTYSFPDKKYLALKNINLTINQGDKIGIVGKSGSGKSTLIDILLLFLIPTSGKLISNNKELEIDYLYSYRNQISIVSQNTYILSASIAENIAFGYKINDIDFDKVKKAISLVELDDFITTLPDGINTTIAENGKNLSGGQKQRIALARAFYKDAELIICDEVTSALDNETELLIIDSIYSKFKNKTLIMIAHRLNTLKGCSIIHVMEAGSIVDSISYQELITKYKKEELDD